MFNYFEESRKGRGHPERRATGGAHRDPGPQGDQGRERALQPGRPGDPHRDRLLKHADFALYQAKGAGRSTFQFYDAEMNARRKARKALEVDLGLALDRRELSLHYQPKVHAITGAVTGIPFIYSIRPQEA